MTLRGLPARIAPVLLTALLVHLAADGFDHAPGLERAPALAALLATALAKGSDAAWVGALAASGLGLYLALELLEGHGLALELPALLASLPAALLVFRAARAARGLLEAAGVAFAAFARSGRVAAPAASAVPRGRVAGGASVRAAGAHSGRAPPLLA
jgi:hypothetical protein